MQHSKVFVLAEGLSRLKCSGAIFHRHGDTNTASNVNVDDAKLHPYCHCVEWCAVHAAVMGGCECERERERHFWRLQI